MNHFQSAFTTWLKNHPGTTLRTLSHESGVDSSMLSLIRKGTRSITLDSITKLLPTIEQRSSRPAAVTLLIAYLTDETPPSHADTIRIEPIDAAGKPTADTYHQLASRWETKARTDPEFMGMWQGMDAYMHSPEDLTTRYPQPTPGADIALLAEPVKTYGGGSSHDTNRHDAMPIKYAAQEHHEP